MNFREKLRELRKDKDLTVRELGKKSGVSASYISMLENGVLSHDPSEEIIHKIEKGLGVEKDILWSCAATPSTTTIKAIYSNHERAKKMNEIVEEINKDPKNLDKLLKILKK